MTHASLTIIRREHRALSAMLRAITLLLSEHRRRGTLPDFSALRGMLFYVDEFHEMQHHPKESLLLFPKLRGRATQTDAVLDRLDRDHSQSERSIRDLEHLLLGLEMMGDTDQRESRLEKFELTFKSYVGCCFDHMRVEETEVLPLAEAVLDAKDWAELDAAFLMNRDALAGSEAEEAYRPLFKRILRSLEASRVGASIGSALEAFSGSASPKFDSPQRD
ncbi:MAG: hemerythrin domain-containing protein [Variovorax sp.]|nr:MAG: hemerythrin domain-containing protein [Variovorax sp.]